MPTDGYTVLLLHCNGNDASTSFTDETGKAVTANGNAQIDTAQSKFGGASCILDGTGDYLSLSDSADWQLDGGSNSNAWTIDFWLRFNGDPTTTDVGFVQQYVDANNTWSLYLSSNVLFFRVVSGAAGIINVNASWNPATATWYHVAIVKNGTTGYLLFVDGTQIGTTLVDTDPLPDFAGGLRIGLVNNLYVTNAYLNGWIDEFRISKGIARWTANFTPPTEEYSSGAANFLAFL